MNQSFIKIKNEGLLALASRRLGRQNSFHVMVLFVVHDLVLIHHVSADGFLALVDLRDEIGHLFGLADSLVVRTSSISLTGILSWLLAVRLHEVVDLRLLLPPDGVHLLRGLMGSKLLVVGANGHSVMLASICSAH